MKNKIAIENANYKILEDNRILLEYEEFEEPKSMELQEELLKLGENITISIKPYKEKKVVERPPTYKYECNCGTKFKSKVEDLEIHCKRCDRDFELEE